MKTYLLVTALGLLLSLLCNIAMGQVDELSGDPEQSISGDDWEELADESAEQEMQKEHEAQEEQEEPGVNVSITAIFIDDPQVGQMTILGQDFDKTSDDSPEPLVTLGDFPPLEILPLEARDEGTRIIAFLPPGIVDGDYHLSVSVGEGEGHNIGYHLTVGAVGQPGPQGERGNPGRRGPHGERGRDAYVACIWYGSSNDLFGLGPFPYVNDMLIQHLGEGVQYFRPADSFSMLPGPDGIEIKQRGMAVYFIAIGAMAVDDEEATVEIRLNPGKDDPTSGIILAGASASGRPAYIYADTRALLKQGDVVSAVFTTAGGGRLYSRTAGAGSFFQICADFKPKQLELPEIKKTDSG